MSRDRHRQIEELFQDLLDLPVEERESELETRCGHDETLRREVRALLEHHEAAQPDFLQEPVFVRGADDHELPSSVGPYTVVGRLGEGSFGVVYEAEQEHPKRRVAVKVLRAGLYSKTQLSRFRTEWDALGRLNHSGIANVHAAGTGEVVFPDRPSVELPYLAMELVRGQDLVTHVEDLQLDRESRLKLFAEVCDAIHYAHEQSVIHRDLKPRNIVVDASCQPKILDFGVARITDQERTQNTRTGDVIGTVRYMSPEQLFGRDVDTRSDIYSLGVILYEMLTGQSPYGESDTSMATRILWHERGSVPRIGDHDPTLRGEIDAIVRMAMAFEREERYQSAADLADDVRRYLARSPVRAPPENRRDAWKRLVRRRRGAIAATVSAVAVAGAIGVRLVDPFGTHVSPARGIASGERVAVMYYDNLVEPDDPQRRGEIITELLISGLSQSERLNIVSSQRLHDLLEVAGTRGTHGIDRTNATELARRAGARWMVRGRVLQSEPSLVVTTEISDVETGNVAVSLRTAGSPGETVFSVVDRVTSEMLDAVAISDRRAMAPSEISTRSEDAYRHYLDGKAYSRQQFLREARDSFVRALEADSTFAIAALHLATRVPGVSSKDRLGYGEQARRHIDHASWRDRQYIEELGNGLGGLTRAAKTILSRYPNDTDALENLAWFAPPDERMSHARRLVEIDPQNEIGFNALSYAYSAQGDVDKALWAVDRYAELSPDEPNVHDTRGEIYARHGRIDQAIAAYARAVEMKPDFGNYGAVETLGHLYACKAEYDSAAARFAVLIGAKEARVRARGRLAIIRLLAYRGRVEEALAQTEGAVMVDRIDGLDFMDSEFERLRLAAVLLHDVGEDEAALSEMTAAFKGRGEETAGSTLGVASMAASLARIGASQVALQYLARFEAQVDSMTTDEQRVHDRAKGLYELSVAQYEEAAAHLEKAGERAEVRFARARSYIGGARWEEAVALLQPLATDYAWWGRFAEPLEAARLHYYLGVAYHELGRADEAIARLEEFVSIWEDADPRLEGPDDARRRLAALHSVD